MRAIISVLVCVLLLKCSAQKLTEEILDAVRGYDREKRPDGPTGPNSPIDVAVSLYFLDISTPENSGHDFTLQLYFRQYWRDPRLKYTPQGFESFKTLSPELVQKIWVPDLFFIQEIHGSHNVLTVPNSFLRWNKDGRMAYSNRYTLTARCPMDLRFYPHDIQNCSLSIESYGYTAEEMALSWNKKHDITFAEDMQDGNFHIIRTEKDVAQEQVQSGNYTRLRVDIIMKRNVGVYITKLYMPYILLAIVSISSVWINPKFAKIRLSLLLTVLFIMLLLMVEVGKISPVVGYTTAMDLWIAFNISFVFALFMEYILVIQTSGEKKRCSDNSVTTEIELGKDTAKEDAGDSSFLPLKQKLSMNPFFGSQRYQNICHNLDGISRIVFPLLLGVFNLIYWVVCAS